MCWGFPGDGWEPLIRQAAAKIEAIVGELPEGERALMTSAQVKEKFGVLRWYMTATNERVRAAIREAVETSEQTCEDCGAPGTLKSLKGWWFTLCDRCRKVRGDERAAREAKAATATR